MTIACIMIGMPDTGTTICTWITSTDIILTIRTYITKAAAAIIISRIESDTGTKI